MWAFLQRYQRQRSSYKLVIRHASTNKKADKLKHEIRQILPKNHISENKDMQILGSTTAVMEQEYYNSKVHPLQTSAHYNKFRIQKDRINKIKRVQLCISKEDHILLFPWKSRPLWLHGFPKTDKVKNPLIL